MAGEPTRSVRWWLGLQVGIGLAGGLAWFAGAMLREDFVAGVGCGMLIGALALRLGRKAAEGTE